MNLNCVIFWDFDATLAYRDGRWTATLHELLARNSIEVSYNELRPFLSLGFPWDSPDSSHEELFKGRTWWEYMNQYFAEICMRFGCDKYLAEKIASQVKDEYMRIDKWFLYDDTLPVLKYFKEKGYPQYIISNHVPELPELVRVLGLEFFFNAIFSSALVGYDKPSRRIYEHARKTAGNPALAIMVGDNYRADVAGALRAGFRAILVRADNKKEYSLYSRDLQGVVEMVEWMKTGK